MLYKKIDDYELITEYDNIDLDQKTISDYYVDDKFLCDVASAVTLRHNRCADSVYKTISLESISLCIKHVQALKRFISSDQNEYLLMLEDDCFFYDNSNTPIEQIISKCPEGWDIIFIGGAFSYNILPIEHINGNYLLAGHPSTNTTSSMIYNKKSARKTLEKILPFYLPIDWQLNNVFHQNNFNVYHTIPYLCGQKPFSKN
jgi:hypothetical protein